MQDDGNHSITSCLKPNVPLSMPAAIREDDEWIALSPNTGAEGHDFG